MLEENKAYTLSEFIAALKESQEFKPKRGANVEREDRKNNGKAVDDILKQAKEYDGGITDEKKRENPRDVAIDYNKTTLDNEFAYEPSKEYKARVKAQVHGFPSAENEKNSKIEDENEGLDFEGNKSFYKADKEKMMKIKKEREDTDKSGLQGRELAPDHLKINTSFDENNSKSKNESKKMKRLHFNKSVFLNEEAMIKKIPDDMKRDGNKFLMKDSVGNEYLIECVADKVIKDYVHTNVVEYHNAEKLNESLNRMKELYDYKSSNYNTVNENFSNEDNDVRKMINDTEKFVNKEEKSSEKFFKTLIG